MKHLLRSFNLWLLLIVAFAAILRLKGIHNPILDHPAWRQGDTASIARNFAHLKYNLLFPQTNYDGPPPNYVELELQIVPFLAATLYKIFGVHEIFGRLITLGFSLGTVAVVGLFGRWLFSNPLAGIAAALFYAIFPGAVYYGRTFTPDTTMVFFLTAALYVVTRLIVEDEVFSQRSLARATALLTFAYLAKPVAVTGIVAVIAALWERLRSGRTMRPTAILVLLAVPLVILYLYDYRVAEHAEWRWASSITKLHVIPGLISAFTSASGFATDIGRVESSSKCQNVEEGWYYDDPDRPTKVLACPQTCKQIQAGGENSKLEVLFGCATAEAPIVVL